MSPIVSELASSEAGGHAGRPDRVLFPPIRAKQVSARRGLDVSSGAESRCQAPGRRSSRKAFRTARPLPEDRRFLNGAHPHQRAGTRRPNSGSDATDRAATFDHRHPPDSYTRDLVIG